MTRKPLWSLALLASAMVAFVATLVPMTVSAQGVDTLEAIIKPNFVTDANLMAAAQDPNNWLHYGRDYAGTRYSPLSEINGTNIKKLVPKWNLSFGVLEGQDSQAVAYNGVVFVTSSFNKVWALDGTNGKVLWKYERELPGDVYPHLCCDVVNRGVALYKDKVYLATLDSHIVALDNATGKVVWDKQVGDYTYSESFTTMPLALHGMIIAGTAGAEYGVRGWIVALDADSGNQVWKTFTIPAAGEPGAETWGGESYKYGGGSAWITGSYDPENNTLYYPVGNPGPDFDRHVRPGDNLFTNTTLALDPDTGKMKFYFQYTPNDPYDYDGVNEVVLADVAGKKVWLHGDRNGHLYSVDRTNGKCVWVVPLGRVNWVKSWGPNCRPIMNWPEKDVVYDKVTQDIAPTLDGGKEWHPISYSLRTKLVYVPVYDFSMDLQAKKMEWKRGEWYLGAKVIRLNPGSGATKAYDAATGKLVWSRPQSTPGTGGVLSTGGGLVFFGDPEGLFTAVRDDTGETLWQYNVGTGIHGNPTSFTAGGHQYVAVVVGPGGGGIWPLYYSEWYKKQSKGGGLFVFGLSE